MISQIIVQRGRSTHQRENLIRVLWSQTGNCCHQDLTSTKVNQIVEMAYTIPGMIVAMSIVVTTCRHISDSESIAEVGRSVGKTTVSPSRLHPNDNTFSFVLLKNNLLETEWVSRDVIRTWLRDAKERAPQFIKRMTKYCLTPIAMIGAVLVLTSAPPFLFQSRILSVVVGFVAAKPAADITISTFKWIDRVSWFYDSIINGRKIQRCRNN